MFSSLFFCAFFFFFFFWCLVFGEGEAFIHAARIWRKGSASQFPPAPCFFLLRKDQLSHANSTLPGQRTAYGGSVHELRQLWTSVPCQAACEFVSLTGSLVPKLCLDSIVNPSNFVGVSVIS